jgi:enediyne biosynthesis protein E8
VALDEEQVKVMTLEAYADTIVPGEKRSPDDHAIAGVSEGGGAVQSGALDLLNDPASGTAAGLPFLAVMANGHAQNYAAEHNIELDPELPAFVSLPYEHRAQLIIQLTAHGHPERDGWILLAMFSSIAFDTAAHLPTQQAYAEGHPGLLQMGYYPPNEDGLYRFPEFSYNKPLARRRPDTTPSGSPV